MVAQRTILLTNIWLAAPGGTEVVVRDLALGFMRRGHRSIVYSPTLGAFADELISRGVPVIDDLRQLGEAPDIIHAHHSIPCGEAIIRFPTTPAIQVCHGFVHWVEAPVHFPQIGAYVAVDEACRARLVHREAIAAKHVVVLPNAVDLTRVPPRPEGLRAQPERALSLTKAAAVPQIRAVCDQLGIAFKALGFAGDRLVLSPERELIGADLVFATARSALEALCCGCAVIVCDVRGLAGLVTAENFERLRAQNFGLQSLAEPVSESRLLEEIARYNPGDAALVAERARREADLETLLDRIEQLHGEVLYGFRRPIISADAHAAAVGRFLHDNLPRRPADARWPWLGEREALLDEIRVTEERNQQLAAADQDLRRLFTEFAEERDQIERSKLWRVVRKMQSLARTLGLARRRNE